MRAASEPSAPYSSSTAGDHPHVANGDEFWVASQAGPYYDLRKQATAICRGTCDPVIALATTLPSAPIVRALRARILVPPLSLTCVAIVRPRCPSRCAALSLVQPTIAHICAAHTALFGALSHNPACRLAARAHSPV